MNYGDKDMCGNVPEGVIARDDMYREGSRHLYFGLLLRGIGVEGTNTITNRTYTTTANGSDLFIEVSTEEKYPAISICIRKGNTCVSTTTTNFDLGKLSDIEKEVDAILAPFKIKGSNRTLGFTE